MSNLKPVVQTSIPQLPLEQPPKKRNITIIEQTDGNVPFYHSVKELMDVGALMIISRSQLRQVLKEVIVPPGSMVVGSKMQILQGLTAVHYGLCRRLGFLTSLYIVLEEQLENLLPERCFRIADGLASICELEVEFEVYHFDHALVIVDIDIQALKNELRDYYIEPRNTSFGQGGQNVYKCNTPLWWTENRNKFYFNILTQDKMRPLLQRASDGCSTDTTTLSALVQICEGYPRLQDDIMNNSRPKKVRGMADFYRATTYHQANIMRTIPNALLVEAATQTNPKLTGVPGLLEEGKSHGGASEEVDEMQTMVGREQNKRRKFGTSGDHGHSNTSEDSKGNVDALEAAGVFPLDLKKLQTSEGALIQSAGQVLSKGGVPFGEHKLSDKTDPAFVMQLAFGVAMMIAQNTSTSSIGAAPPGFDLSALTTQQQEIANLWTSFKQLFSHNGSSLTNFAAQSIKVDGDPLPGNYISLPTMQPLIESSMLPTGELKIALNSLDEPPPVYPQGGSRVVSKPLEVNSAEKGKQIVTGLQEPVVAPPVQQLANASPEVMSGQRTQGKEDSGMTKEVLASMMEMFASMQQQSNNLQMMLFEQLKSGKQGGESAGTGDAGAATRGAEPTSGK